MKQCHIKVEIPIGTEEDDEVAIEKAVEEARLKAIAIRKEWERRYCVARLVFSFCRFDVVIREKE